LEICGYLMGGGGRYPLSLGDLISVLLAKAGGHRRDVSAVESVIWQMRGPGVMAFIPG
jgi:hypothetical protein